MWLVRSVLNELFDEIGQGALVVIGLGKDHGDQAVVAEIFQLRADSFEHDVSSLGLVVVCCMNSRPGAG